MTDQVKGERKKIWLTGTESCEGCSRPRSWRPWRQRQPRRRQRRRRQRRTSFWLMVDSLKRLGSLLVLRSELIGMLAKFAMVMLEILPQSWRWVSRLFIDAFSPRFHEVGSWASSRIRRGLAWKWNYGLCRLALLLFGDRHSHLKVRGKRDYPTVPTAS